MQVCDKDLRHLALYFFQAFFELINDFPVRIFEH
jgi:hypothetical protein